MKFSINRTELANALSIVLKGVSTRSTLPVLSGILIEAAGDKIILQATDLELSIQYSVAALVEEEGRTVVPGKLFSEIVKTFPMLQSMSRLPMSRLSSPATRLRSLSAP